MKWRFVEKWDRMSCERYWLGRKKGCIIHIFPNKFRGKWNFSIERTKDDFTFNSAWENHPNPEYTRFIKELLEEDISSISIEQMQEFIEKWVDKNVPVIRKEG